MRLVVAIPVLCALLPAQTEPERRALRENFQSMDGNGDGQLARGEFPGSDRQFADMDRDRNGQVDLEEFASSEVARRFLAATYRNSLEPRPRTTAQQLRGRRLQWIARFDGNRDGKLTREEWSGSPAAFSSLDGDGNGVIDARDGAESEDIRTPGSAEFPEFTSRLPEPETLMSRLDRNADETLSPREVGSQPLARVFVLADLDRDGQLSLGELRRIATLVAQAVNKRNRGYVTPRAFVVPFDVWDENDDGRLEQGEWVQRRNLFARIDHNRDSAVTPDEIERYRRSVEGVGFLERFDLNDDGRVTLVEFGGSPEAFRRADRNGDGVVSRRDR